MFRHVRCVLFDLDGTLIDSAPDLGQAANEMRVARGLPSLPAAAYRSNAGSGARGMLAVAFGLTPENDRFDVLREEFFDRYEQRMTRATRLFETVPRLLDALGAGLPECAGVDVLAAAIVCVAVTFGVRILAVLFNWSLPEQRRIERLPKIRSSRGSSTRR